MFDDFNEKDINNTINFSINDRSLEESYNKIISFSNKIKNDFDSISKIKMELIFPENTITAPIIDNNIITKVDIIEKKLEDIDKQFNTENNSVEKTTDKTSDEVEEARKDEMTKEFEKLLELLSDLKLIKKQDTKEKTKLDRAQDFISNIKKHGILGGILDTGKTVIMTMIAQWMTKKLWAWGVPFTKRLIMIQLPKIILPALEGMFLGGGIEIIVGTGIFLAPAAVIYTIFDQIDKKIKQSEEERWKFMYENPEYSKVSPDQLEKEEKYTKKIENRIKTQNDLLKKSMEGTTLSENKHKSEGKSLFQEWLDKFDISSKRDRELLERKKNQDLLPIKETFLPGENLIGMSTSSYTDIGFNTKNDKPNINIEEIELDPSSTDIGISSWDEKAKKDSEKIIKSFESLSKNTVMFLDTFGMDSIRDSVNNITDKMLDIFSNPEKYLDDIGDFLNKSLSGNNTVDISSNGAGQGLEGYFFSAGGVGVEGESYAKALASIESSGGDYRAVGVPNESLGEPLGAYQIMEYNVKNLMGQTLENLGYKEDSSKWNREELKEFFLSHSDVQDEMLKLFTEKTLKTLTKSEIEKIQKMAKEDIKKAEEYLYGLLAAAHLSGNWENYSNLNVKDVLGTSSPEYIRKTLPIYRENRRQKDEKLDFKYDKPQSRIDNINNMLSMMNIKEFINNEEQEEEIEEINLAGSLDSPDSFISDMMDEKEYFQQPIASYIKDTDNHNLN